jgi:hypothetical protein
LPVFCVVAALIIATLLNPADVNAITPKIARRLAVEGILRLMLVVYALVATAAIPGTLIVGGLLYRARRQGSKHLWLARAFALCLSCLLALIGVETAATARRSWTHRMPPLPTRFPESDDQEVSIVVIGGSSALGEPYRPWVSVGQLVAWRLQEAHPERRFHLEILAELGATLEDMHHKLSELRRKPDLLIIDTGHNEFAGRYEEQRGLSLHEAPANPLLHAAYQASLSSPFCRLVYEVVSRHRLGSPPLHVTKHHLIDPPQCSPSEYAEVVSDFQRRFEAIVSYCETIGCLAVVVIPPSNDAGFEPSRSVLPPTTTQQDREAVAEEFTVIRAGEATAPAEAPDAYRDFLRRYPGFAEAHFRLARLLESQGRWIDANWHYIQARDHDGLVIRCPTALEEIQRKVAARHVRSCLLVDGPTALRSASPHVIINDRLIQDAHHPTLMGQIVLARAVLRILAHHAARDPESPFQGVEPSVASLDPAACAEHFGLDARAWVMVCERTSTHYRRVAQYRYDPAERLAKAERFARAAREIAEGTPPEATGVPGLGWEPGLPPPARL